jgi:TnpA family transposase
MARTPGAGYGAMQLAGDGVFGPPRDPDEAVRVLRTDYGPLNAFARGRIDLGRIRAHWQDILRVVVSIYTGEVRAYDVVRMLQRDGHPTALGEAIASYGRIPKTLHICTLAAGAPYRRDIKAMRNLQEGRCALAAKGIIRQLRDPDAADDELPD